jgi:hypothetical protein
LANDKAKRYIYAADGVEEEHTALRRNGARPVGTERGQLSGSIHGKRAICTETGCADDASARLPTIRVADRLLRH